MKNYFSFSNILTVSLIFIAVLYYLYQKGYILADFENISPKEAYSLIQKEKDKVVILDVRTPQEVIQEGKIENALVIPLDQLAQNMDKLKVYKNKKIIVYCRSGNRSVAAARLLSSLGFKVFNIKGGISEWKEEGLPLQKE